MLKSMILVSLLMSFGLPIQAKVLTNLKNNTNITNVLNKQIKLLDLNEVLEIPSGTYFIDAVQSIELKSNVNLKLQPDTEFRVLPNSQKSYKVFKIHEVSNVKITGGIITGDKYTHSGKDGEWGMGVEIKDSQNITISNMNINKMWGDAIYLGANGKNSNYNITLDKITMDDNRRQGLTIVSVNTLNANNLTITNTNGKSPMNAVDIEPNSPSNILKNIKFYNLISYNNKGTGFQVSLKQYKNSKNDISISLDKFIDNGSKMGLRINHAETNISGTININNTTLKNNKVSNYCFKRWNHNQIKININGISYDKPYTHKKEWCDPYQSSAYLKII